MIWDIANVVDATAITMMIAWIIKGRQRRLLSLAVDLTFLAAAFLYIAAESGNLLGQLILAAITVFWAKILIDDIARSELHFPWHRNKS